MNRKWTTALLLVACSLMGAGRLYAQTDSTQQGAYKDYVGENPDADADIRLVSNYINSLIGGDVDKATAMLAPNYKGFGPGPDDSTDAKTTADTWKQNYQIQSNRKINFLPATFNVKSGDQEGHWVTTWGTYTFTQDGKDVRIPYQYTAHIADGKIDRDVIYFDQLSIVRTLGYTLTPPSK